MEHDFKLDSGSISFLSWNVNGGVDKKLKSTCFEHFIKTYNVIILSECWIPNDYHIDIDGFHTCIIPRKLTNATQGGGIIVLIDLKVKQHIDVCEIICDSIVWLKIDKNLLCQTKDVYLAKKGVYIPPVNSVYYNKYNCDLFFELEASLNRYTLVGEIMLMGDFNSRTSTVCDFVHDDSIHSSIERRLSDLFNYIPDDKYDVRVNPDNVVNQFGNRLIDLCKSSSIRIFNGRDVDGFSNDYTYCGHNGMSVIDYLILNPSLFHCVKMFIVCDFNVLSDHAPLHLQMYTRSSLDERGTARADTHIGTEMSTYRWNDESNGSFLETLATNHESINESVIMAGEITQDSIDTCVGRFTNELVRAMSPFLSRPNTHVNTHTASAVGHDHVNIQCNSGRGPRICEDKPWFDSELKRIFYNYKNALNLFNRFKSADNRNNLISKKKVYKAAEALKKRQYMKFEGDMLEYLRKYNPKQFYMKFSSPKSTGPQMSMDVLYDHFKRLSSEVDVDTGATDVNTSNDDSVPLYDELDCPITAEEITIAIRNLNRGKSHGFDGILNECFLVGKDLLLPSLCLLFNGV